MSTLPPFEPVVPPPVAPRRNTLLLIIIGALAGVILIGAGGAALAWGLLNRRANNIPQMLPADVQFYAAITPTLGDLPNIERLRRAFPEAFDYENNATTADGLEEQLGVTVAEDVTPWLGTEVAVAVRGLPLNDLAALSAGNQSLENLDQVQAALILASRDNKAAAAFLDKQRAHREGKGESFTSSEIDGVTIYAQAGDEVSPIAAFALVRDYVVFANQAAVIQGMIERDNDGPETLQANTRFNAVLTAMPADRMGFIYVDGQAMGDLVRASSEQAAETIESSGGAGQQQLDDALKVAEAMQGMGLSLAVIEAGVRFDATTVIDRAALPENLVARIEEQGQPVAPDRSGQVSASALGSLSFRIPASFGEQINEIILSLPDGEAQLAQYEEALGLDLQEDFFAWFHGEAVLALFPDQGAAPVSGYFALTPTDRAAAERGVEKIVAALEQASGGELGLAETEVGGATFQAIDSPQGMAGYGFVGDDLVLGFGQVGLEAASGADSTLADNTSYKAAIAALPAPNAGLLFVDLPAIVQMGRDMGGIDEEAAARMAPFRAIVAAGAPGIDAQGVSHGSMLVVIGE